MINEQTLDEFVRRLCAGDRVALAQAMTLVESQLSRHQRLSQQLLDTIMPATGRAIRIGITGTPGAGKSTFLNTFGMMLVGLGKRVAVIAVDPSSPLSGGSLLGDKTRMTELARADAAFIRPVPSGGATGGISPHAGELILLCEAANYDVVIVETVGVGQSETEVAGIVDCFVSLQIAGGGDELQGIKKGIMEMADVIVINKDDGDNRAAVAIARQIYDSALAIVRHKYPPWRPAVLSCSALEKRGIEDVWQAVVHFYDVMTKSGYLKLLRQQQTVTWLRKQVEEEAVRQLYAHRAFREDFNQTLDEVKNHQQAPRTGLQHIREYLQHHYFAR
ncbi:MULTISPECIES: methylmalonyl Co-A mutase-associated GTPase MeaB [Kosakonia]|uniref:methylmalonyl Co-A mutase-associated GTPase MeaB n=1 Tax=Kosakonia TaxID=1330547 RepID=UPI0013642CA0|nr:MULTISPECIES: methylmalonyl Co-A mutase-associated GTPase MeaB [Kosakonia]QHM95971.1 methylmalonyl Co-A mutase-associated GTPase MeaB [Kosakonia sacchari]